MKTFNSKIDTWLLLLIAGAVVVCLVAAFSAFHAGGIEGVVSSLLTVAVGVVLPAWIIFRTKYTVADQLLRIHCGPFSWKVPLDSITAVTETRNPLSSPALSLDRLKIRYGTDKFVMVSPADKHGFLAAIGQQAACET